MYSVETTISRDSREGFSAFFFVNAGLCVIFFFFVCVLRLKHWCPGVSVLTKVLTPHHFLLQ